MSNYAGAFIERENSLILSDMLEHLHMKTMVQMDVDKIEDAQCDILIGKSGDTLRDQSNIECHMPHYIEPEESK